MSNDGSWVHGVAVPATARMLQRFTNCKELKLKYNCWLSEKIIGGGLNGTRVTDSDFGCLLLGFVTENDYEDFSLWVAHL